MGERQKKFSLTEFRTLGKRTGWWRATLGWMNDFFERRKLPVHLFILRAYPPGWFLRERALTDDRYAFRIATTDEIKRAMADYPKYLEPSLVRTAMANGDICAAAFDGDRMVAFHWYANAPTSMFPRISIHVRAPNYYVYNTFTAEEHRGRRLHTKLAVFAGQTFARNSGIVAFIALNNVSSLLAADYRKKSGMQPDNAELGICCLIRYRKRLVWLRMPRTTRACRDLGVEFLAEDWKKPEPA
jgi:hypothetical protein